MQKHRIVSSLRPSAVARRFRGIANWLVLAQASVGGFGLLFMTLLIAVDIFLRYAFKAPTGVATELGEYLMLLIVSFGLAYALKNRTHIIIEFFILRLPRGIASWLLVVTSGISLFFCSYLTWILWGQFMNAWTNGTTSINLGIIMWPVKLIAPLGLGLMSLLLVLNFYDELKGAIGKSYKPEPG